MAAAIVAVAAKEIVSGGHAQSLTITVAGRSAQLPAGTTLAQAARMLALRPSAGNLLDVEGGVLRTGVFPGRLLLDGRPARAATMLHAGDRISLAAGRNRSEHVSRQILPLPAGVVGDPQFTLARSPSEQIITRGAISHKLVSAHLSPSSGTARVERAVALTFDDGPSPRYTPLILATLRKLHVHATFFVVGYLADEYPELVRRELHAGMSVGNHSYNHPEVPPFDQLPRRLAEDEITLGAQSLRQLGARPALFRPPGGSSAANVVQAAKRLGERVVLWSVDPGDWRPGMTPRQIARGVLTAVRPGSIIILHDGGGDRSATAAALPAIVKGIRHRRLRLLAIRPR